MSKIDFKSFLVVGLLCVGFFSRIWLSTLGHNYDLESYQIVGGLVINQKNVYANTSRYNYGSIWFLILGLIKYIQIHLGFTGIRSFHVLITSFLSFVDLAIASILTLLFDKRVGLIFFLCPISILITGYHSQFDNLAILIALCSWLCIRDAKMRKNRKNIIISAILMGLSLATKHIFIFFPLWILVWQAFGSLKRRATFILISYGIFFLSFLPFLFESRALSGIKNNVFNYASDIKFSLFRRLIQLFVPVDYIQNQLSGIPIFSGIKFLWLVAMIITGLVIVKKYPKNTFFYYLIALMIWTTAVADQYLAIPVAACAVFWRKFPSWCYITIASLVLIASPNNIGTLESLTSLQSTLQNIGLRYYHAQVWLLVLLISAILEPIHSQKFLRDKTENNREFQPPRLPNSLSRDLARESHLLSRSESPHHIILIGAGFTSLAAAYELSRLGIQVTVLEADEQVGGLAGSFQVNGETLEKFYHHWFTNDRYVMDLIKELQAEDRIIYRPTRTGIYYANKFYKLSSPADLLRFQPLNWLDRIRLGLLVLQVRLVKDWKPLESLTTREWLIQLCGREVYRVVWEPLMRGKFGPFAADISAVWFWNKLKLRGGSRSKDGAEMLAYYRGGFAALANRIAEEVESQGGQIKTSTPVQGLVVEEGRVIGVQTHQGVILGDGVIATPALPIIADWVEPYVSSEYTEKLRKINYLANVCLVLELDRSLSQTYWLNVNDPNFPFVGVIEHTNFEPKETYGGRHIVYLSKYLPETAELYQMSDEQALNYSIPHLQRMFPEFSRDWIKGYHFWRAKYSQPIVVRDYSQLIPDWETPLAGFYIATMAQIYPEDRGTNYAIREGRKIARLVAKFSSSLAEG